MSKEAAATGVGTKPRQSTHLQRLKRPYEDDVPQVELAAFKQQRTVQVLASHARPRLDVLQTACACVGETHNKREAGRRQR